MDMDQLLAWTDERIVLHRKRLRKLSEHREKSMTVTAWRNVIRRQQEVVREFEIVADGLRKELEHAGAEQGAQTKGRH